MRDKVDWGFFAGGLVWVGLLAMMILALSSCASITVNAAAGAHVTVNQPKTITVPSNVTIPASMLGM